MTWLGVFLCLMISSTFSGIEAGILSVNRVRLRHRLNQGDAAARKLDRLLSRPERLLVTVLLVTNFMNISAIILGTQEIVRLIGPWGYVIAFVVSLPVYLFGVELLPKAVFRRFPYRGLAAVSELLRITDLILSPLLWIGAQLRRLLLGHVKLRERKLFVAREDFKYLTIESEREGAISKVEREMIHNVVDFRAVLAQDVMIPIQSVETIRSDATIEELLERARAGNLDQLPVVAPDGEVTGLVSVLEILLNGTNRGRVGSYQRRIISVEAGEQAYRVIQKMRAARISMAVVRDEKSKEAGIVHSDVVISRLVKTAVT